MASNLFKSTPSYFNFSNPKSHMIPANRFITSYRLPPNSNPNLLTLSIKPSDSSFSTRASIPRPVPEEYLEKSDDGTVDTAQLKQLRLKLVEMGIPCKHCSPGVEYRFICPMCKGGGSKEMSLAFLISEDGNSAVWKCFRAKCGWVGRTRGSADIKSSYNMMKKITPKVKPVRRITVQELELEPLSCDLHEYFAERMISQETLRRNNVMQRYSKGRLYIAFTYKRKGELISCKYRGLPKSFWQVEPAVGAALLACNLLMKEKGEE
ncbi:twinkle homolog protein, chloroplastic/mitochondrial-like [Bidens hawaiensis]|uniref:twinkle homolog protein, chloroplastic/mitochondrial-like n=1 Tax=Bidens hawaiensis TaxID=980011 RepID=UPI00404A275B